MSSIRSAWFILAPPTSSAEGGRIALGKVLRIEPMERDLYGRVVADVILPDGRSLNQERWCARAGGGAGPGA